MTIPKSAMRLDLSALVAEWGVTCGVQRYSSTILPDRRLSGSFVSVSTQVLWIQPRSGGVTRSPEGLREDTTHITFQSYGGYDMRAEDKVTPSGETQEYDVTAVHLKENHRMIEMKRVEET